MGFRMRREPVKPKREMIERTLVISNGLRLSKVIEWADLLGVKPSDIRIDSKWDYEYAEHYFVAFTQETDEEFSVRNQRYMKELEKYNEWVIKNKDKIELHTIEEKRKYEKARKKREKEIDEKIKKLQKELKSLGLGYDKL